MNGAYNTCIPQVTTNADAVHTEPLYLEYIRYEVEVYIQVLIVLHDDGVVDVYTNCMCYMYTLYLNLFKCIHTYLPTVPYDNYFQQLFWEKGSPPVQLLQSRKPDCYATASGGTPLVIA